MSQLYRQAVLDARKQRLQGEVLLLQPMSLTLTIFLLVCATTMIALFLAFAEYSRKETVQGYLVPDLGVIQSVSLNEGIIERVHVTDGEHVINGEPLVTIRSKSELENGVDVNASTLEELQTQIATISQEITHQQALHEKVMHKQRQWLSDLNAELTAIEGRKNLIERKMILAKEEHLLHQRLFDDGHISAQSMRVELGELLDLQTQQQQILAEELALRKNRNTAISDLEMLPEEYQLNLLERQKEQSSLRQHYSMALANHSHVLTANQDGYVSGIFATNGEAVREGDRLISIIPEEATLVAELMLPTRSAGFVQTGDLVKIRLDAFPYQRFGYVEGTVSLIDSVLIQQENAVFPISEPSYRIRVTLKQAVIEQGGHEYPLKNGLRLEADIVLESRSILGWILEPLYGLLGKI
ncbi:HlyD family efflux transporter periplasmic adaptor subunit [Grimontia sp. S25]|uniref:HlyD family efflux transporter periplasmic adaptor subunit n=1 Tax=Grimontia sedimenti TaxID=2711294 RepID=A0A6M1RKZ1_9GAMM|nr:HlyD family efflux transporter periplasmic adaptor subunit [Grimontia sedimenti]NGN96787.1 HlyD family efflux transporter periplasmic adaptor subunit [Grimontia sedimenti]